MDEQNLSLVEYTTDTCSQALGIPPEQVRLLARKLGITAPYTAQQLDAMRLELMGNTAPVPTQNTAPIPTDEPNSKTLISELADVLQVSITVDLIDEMQNRWPTIQDDVIAALTK